MLSKTSLQYKAQKNSFVREPTSFDVENHLDRVRGTETAVTIPKRKPKTRSGKPKSKKAAIPGKATIVCKGPGDRQIIVDSGATYHLIG